VDIIIEGDFLGLCDQKSSYKHVSDFGRIRSYYAIYIYIYILHVFCLNECGGAGRLVLWLSEAVVTLWTRQCYLKRENKHRMRVFARIDAERSLIRRLLHRIYSSLLSVPFFVATRSDDGESQSAGVAYPPSTMPYRTRHAVAGEHRCELY